MVTVEPTGTTKPKMGRRKDLLLAVSKKNTRDLCQSSVSPEQQNWGSFKLRVHAYSRRGLSRGEFSIKLGQKLTVSKL